LALRAARGLLRARLFALVLITDRSVLNTKNFRAACGLLRPRPLAFRAVRGLLHSLFFPPCASHGLLRVRRLMLRDGLRIAPYADTLHPCVAHGLLRAQHFKLRTGHRLLCARHLTLRSARGYRRALHFAPCAGHGCLRAQPLEFCVVPGVHRTRPLSLRPVPGLLRVRHLALICFLRIAPHSSLSAPVLVADCSVLNT